MRPADRPRLAVWKFSSCDGCQLSLLDCEDALLDIAGAVEIASFPEASSESTLGPYDVSLVEGAVTTPEEEKRIREVRRLSRVLVAAGACATAGGIQALRNLRDVKEFVSLVYATPAYIETLERATPIAEHVPVDIELRGCPISKPQLLEVLSALLAGRRPNLPTYPVCIDCKRRGTVCVQVADGTPCLGPVTQTGCGALCPSYRRGCYGCFGPSDSPNTKSLARIWLGAGAAPADVGRAFHTFNTGAPAFLQEGKAHAQ